ncbi:MAG: methyltransferase domain-containing protein [Rhodospirillales bacterium]|nr:MAG: methyltransferase domain-containing protein [Rhodospirillales bacterium]
MQVFDRRVIRLRRDRAAARLSDHDFLLAEVGERLADRLDDVRRRFPLALDLGCHTGTFGRCLQGRGGIERLVHADLSPSMAAAAPAPAVAADEEVLPFGAGTFDAVFSLLSLHWVNDLPGALLQMRHALKPDGLLLAAMLGGDTLHELRTALMEAEVAVEGGLSPRVSPFADVRDAGMLLQRAGFALPVVDTETVTVSYSDPFKLMRDLRGMGAANAVLQRRRGMTRRATLMTAAARYADRFGDAEGRVPATFQVLYLTAWAPHPDQPRPLRPGSAAGRLADALGTEEVSAGEKARPH